MDQARYNIASVGIARICFVVLAKGSVGADKSKDGEKLEMELAQPSDLGIRAAVNYIARNSRRIELAAIASARAG